MKNFKKLFSVIVALLIIVSTVAVSTVTVSAAKNTAFDGKGIKQWVISKFDDQDNTGGIGVMDEFGKPMTQVPDDASLKVGLPTSKYGEYCGTEYCEFVDDSDATGGTAAKIYVGDGYKSYDKTKIAIRKLGSENIVIPFDGGERAKITIAFYIKVHNLKEIDSGEACIEVSEVQDDKEYYITLVGLSNYLQNTNSKLEEDKWIKVEIPFSQMACSVELNDKHKCDITLNLARVYFNQSKTSGKKFSDADRPYMMIDELTIIQYDKPFSLAPTPVTPTPGKPGNPVTPGKPNAPDGNTGTILKPEETTSDTTDSGRDTSNLPPPANTLTEKPTSSAESVEEVTSDVTSTSTDENDEGFPWLWVIIGAAAVVLLGGGALVLVLVLKKKPAPVADATPAEPEAPTDAE